MNAIIRGAARLLPAEVNTDVNCSSKYLPGKDNAYIAQHAFEKVAPGFPSRFAGGDVIVAGRNFGINSSREQAVHILHELGVAAIVAPSFGRQFFRNAINNGLTVIECNVARVAEGDVLEIDAAGGAVRVPARDLAFKSTVLPPAVQAIVAAGGLLAFLQQHPNWKLA
ncbi:MAG: 3-isopropylmalate dehydratase [Burkholderiales bacterium]